MREFVDAVRRVADGRHGARPRGGRPAPRARRGADGPLAELTPRESEVLALMAEGRTNAAIAERLVSREGAVEKHVSTIFGKLDLPRSEADHRRVMAVATYLRR